MSADHSIDALPAGSPAPAEPTFRAAPSVLQVLPELGGGGVERSTVDIAAALVKAGWRALVASSGGPMVREVERAGARHITLPMAAKNPLVMAANVRRLARLIRAEGVYIVHARSRAPAWSARAAAQRTGAHFVTTFHGTYRHEGALKRRYNSIMLKGERVIANSAFIAEHIRTIYGAPAAPVVTIPRGVDMARFDPTRVGPDRLTALATRWRIPDHLPLVLLPGRLSRWKGQDVMIEALARLKRRDLLVLLVGDDQGRKAYRGELIRQIERHGLGGVVRLADHCSDMPAAYMLADVVVSPSILPEAFGRVAAEAQAMGRAVIATAHGGACETVLNGETGWLVAPGDPAALAAALEQALNLAADRSAREAVAEAARAHIIARGYTLDEMCRRTLGVYQDLLTAEGSVSP